MPLTACSSTSSPLVNLVVSFCEKRGGEGRGAERRCDEQGSKVGEVEGGDEEARRRGEESRAEEARKASYLRDEQGGDLPCRIAPDQHLGATK